MKLILYSFCLFTFAFVGISQEWRDSLVKAREAYKNQDYTKALRYYKGVLPKVPTSIDLSDEIAQTAYKAKYYPTAEKVYQQRTSDNTSSSKKAETYFNLGNAQMKQENYGAAIQSYKEALRYNPEDLQTRYNLSEAMRRMKKEQNKQDQNKSNQPQQQNQNQNQQQNKQKPESKQNQQDARLPDKMVDRMLDQLMKQEAETKKKTTGGKKGNSTSKSGKDW